MVKSKYFKVIAISNIQVNNASLQEKKYNREINILRDSIGEEKVWDWAWNIFFQKWNRVT